MSIDPTHSVVQKPNATTAKTLGIGADDFLKLLVAQIQNQDPLKPMEDTAFIAQTAQFSQLEETRNINFWLETMTCIQGSGLVSGFAHLIGKHVSADSDGQLINGEVDAVVLDGGRVFLVVDGTKVEPGDVYEIAKEKQDESD